MLRIICGDRHTTVAVALRAAWCSHTLWGHTWFYPRGGFKKTLPAPGASLLQVRVRSADLRARAISLLQKAREAHPKQARLNFLVLALRGKKVGFEKVISMIDAMVSSLKKEQMDDSDKKEYCLATFDSTEDKIKELEHVASDTETAIASAEEKIAALADEIEETEKSISALDSSVRAATAMRKAENEDYKALVQADYAAKELLLFAKNRLNKFYNPKLYNPPAKKELSRWGPSRGTCRSCRSRSTCSTGTVWNRRRRLGMRTLRRRRKAPASSQ